MYKKLIKKTAKGNAKRAQQERRGQDAFNSLGKEIAENEEKKTEEMYLFHAMHAKRNSDAKRISDIAIANVAKAKEKAILIKKQEEERHGRWLEENGYSAAVWDAKRKDAKKNKLVDETKEALLIPTIPLLSRNREESSEESKMLEDHKNLEKLPPHILAELENILEGVDTKGDQPFKIFVDNYLSNPEILDKFNIRDLIENPDWWIKFPFEPLIQSDTSDLSFFERKDMMRLSDMTREAIMKHGNVSGKEGKDGKTFIIKGVTNHTKSLKPPHAYGRNGVIWREPKQYAVKMYHTYKYIPGSDHFAQKSIRMIQKETYLQERAAKVGICPRILALNEEERYVIMEKMEETIVDYAKRNRGEKSEYVLPVVHQDRIIEMMYKLDEVGVLHNDGNPLNLMFNDNNELMLVNFGLSELIDDAMLEKRGIHPNVSLTMWDFNRRLGHYRITTPKLKNLCDKYTKDFKLGLNRARLKEARTSSSSEGV